MSGIPKTEQLFDLSHSIAGGYLRSCTYPFEALCFIGEWIKALGEHLPPERYEKIGDCIWIAKSASVAKTALLMPPLIVGERSEIRHGAYLRGDVIVGEDCVVGNSTEVKNSILFDRVQVPHFNYVGDSILGYRAHFGAGVIASNVRADKGEVVVRTGDAALCSGRRKLGVMAGDGCEIGCGAVLAPGAVIGKNSVVYPLSFVRGTLLENCIFKSDKSIIKRISRDIDSH